MVTSQMLVLVVNGKHCKHRKYTAWHKLPELTSFPMQVINARIVAESAEDGNKIMFTHRAATHVWVKPTNPFQTHQYCNWIPASQPPQ